MSPSMPRKSVVLPAPFGPSSATNSPRSIAERDVLQHRPAVVAERDVVERDEHGVPVNRSEAIKSSA